MSLNPKNTIIQTLQNGMIFIPVDIFATYIMIYLLIPYFLKTRKYLYFALFTIVLGFTTIMLNMLISYFIYIPYFYPEWLPKRVFWQGNYWYYLVATYTVVSFGAGVKLTKMWVFEQQDKKELENQKIRSELLMLKSQINPHFLFNTLNNIDALIEKQPIKASESIIRLSDLLRYVIYNTSYDFVSVQKEEDTLRSFIELSTLRFGKDFINYKSKILDPHKTIAPMLLIPLVENAIKHGDKRVGKPIDIELRVDQDIEFRVINYVSDEHINKDSQGGVGLSNLKRRLELIYPDAHIFEQGIDKQIYTSRLWIQ